MVQDPQEATEHLDEIVLLIDHDVLAVSSRNGGIITGVEILIALVLADNDASRSCLVLIG